MEEFDNEDPRTYSSRISEYVLEVKGPDSKYFTKEGEKKQFGSIFVYSIYYWKSFIFLFDESKFFFAYISMAFFGSFIDPIFFSFQLFNIIVFFYFKRLI